MFTSPTWSLQRNVTHLHICIVSVYTEQTNTKVDPQTSAVPGHVFVLHLPFLGVAVSFFSAFLSCVGSGGDSNGDHYGRSDGLALSDLNEQKKKWARSDGCLQERQQTDRNDKHLKEQCTQFTLGTNLVNRLYLSSYQWPSTIMSFHWDKVVPHIVICRVIIHWHSWPPSTSVARMHSAEQQKKNHNVLTNKYK